MRVENGGEEMRVGERGRALEPRCQNVFESINLLYTYEHLYISIFLHYLTRQEMLYTTVLSSKYMTYNMDNLSIFPYDISRGLKPYILTS